MYSGFAFSIGVTSTSFCFSSRARVFQCIKYTPSPRIAVASTIGHHRKLDVLPSVPVIFAAVVGAGPGIGETGKLIITVVEIDVDVIETTVLGSDVDVDVDVMNVGAAVEEGAKRGAAVGGSDGGDVGCGVCCIVVGGVGKKLNEGELVVLGVGESVSRHGSSAKVLRLHTKCVHWKVVHGQSPFTIATLES